LAPDALSLTNVHTFYGDSHSLHGVSFSLQQGGVLALLGRNGAGKTTCISTIIGFLSVMRHGVCPPIGVEGRSRLLPQRMPLKTVAMKAWSEAVLDAYLKADGVWPALRSLY
jgi:ABC-type hemin transport system ATPase subunit